MSCEHKYRKVSAAHGREVARWCPECGFREEVPSGVIMDQNVDGSVIDYRDYRDDFDRTSILSRADMASIRDNAPCVGSARHNEALLRIYLSNMPIGAYSVRDETPTSIYFNGTAIVKVEALCNVLGHPPTVRAAEGLASALVHLLNAREQTEITNGTKP